MSQQDTLLPEPKLWDCDWHDLVRAARAAGHRSAYELARTCTRGQLVRTGLVTVHIEPMDNPVAVWLCHQGQAHLDREHATVSLPISLEPHDLGDVADAVAKARSSLVRHAYAAAYAAMLTDEAGVATTVKQDPDPNPTPAPLLTTTAATTPLPRPRKLARAPRAARQ